MAIAFGIGVALGPTAKIIPPPSQTNPSEIKIQTARRSQTKHANEIGKKKLPDLNERHVNFQQPVLEDFGDGSGAVAYEASMVEKDGADSEEEHLPAGQHLLVDLMNVEADFLNSEERLADAMVESVKVGGLTLLSYHCHSLLPAGVSCVGVLLESHISFHTWPEEGVITLDLFTCGSNPLLPVVPDLERLFGIPRNKPNSSEKEEIISQWSHELRGFRNSESNKDTAYLDNKSDLASWVFSPLLFGSKKEVVSVNSPHQRIDIWDFKEKEATPSHEDAIKAGLKLGDPRWLTSEVASPDRYLFLDGHIQSMKESEKAFHETLVHPAMFAHPKPKHVAVIGGGEGATIRELLKHKTVESVTMIEIDELMVEIAKEHLPYMNDCSDIEGGADSCFEDERTTIIHENAILWFKDHYGSKGKKKKDRPVPSFDVIILDGFDPKDGSEMYSDEAFLDALYASLSEDGVFALHVGSPFTIHDPKPDVGANAPREKFFNILEKHSSTAAMMVYEEAHAGFEEPHAFLTVCKSVDCRSRWYAESIVVDDEIYERIQSSKSGNPALIHYDGATHRTFQITPRAWETVYCRKEPEPFECAYRGLDVNKELFEMGNDEEEGSFDVKTDIVNGKEAKSVYAKEDIPKGSYIMPSDVAASVALTDDIIYGLKDNIAVKETGEVTVIGNFLEFVEKNGHASMAKGTKLNYIEVGGSTFIRKSKKDKEVNVGRWLPAHPSGELPVWSPVYERRMMAFDVFIVATKDIKAGEEIVRPIKF